MEVGLFIPCYIDQLYPDVGMATVEVLQRQGVDVVFPPEQTCCGQPMANTGCFAETRPLAEKFYRIFNRFAYVVCPSGSCVSMVRCHYDTYLSASAWNELASKTYELCEFLTDVMGVTEIAGDFPYRVGLHNSCHGHRELRLALPSEVVGSAYNKVRQLLASLNGIEFVELDRSDECCGFGGTFAVNEAAVSSRMGLDRLEDHEAAGTQVVTASDMSCLMHLGGLIGRYQRPLQVMHVAEILAGRQPRGRTDG